MPVTPGLQYGRVCVDVAQRDVLVCCLCGGSANAMDLGDLHGPYYPEGFKSASKAVCNPQEEDNSDSDSSVRGKRVAPGRWTESLWTSDSQSSNSPSSKRPRMDGDTDWFSPPVVPLNANEHWLHEDCAIWSTSVFLVRGKLYGLENAVRLAKVCSTCQRRGATLGCVFKGCPNKYHYTCALQSGKSSNKSIKGSSYRQINR
uniref:PHD-type domain-containing protein n=1 Tax=Sinocyclocheilus anshuiensis TaxID=1608454 RepID=A0A671QVC5_9TELE